MAATAHTAVVRGDEYACAATVDVGDAVYLFESGTVAKAFGGLPPTVQAIGIVIEKPTTTTARVLGDGASGDIYAGLTFGAVYYLSNTALGGITAAPPSTPGERFQALGTASSTTALAIGVDRTSVIM